MYLINIYLSYLFDDFHRKEEIVAILENATNRYIDRKKYHPRIIVTHMGYRIKVVLEEIKTNRKANDIITLAQKILKENFDDFDIQISENEIRWWEPHTKFFAGLVSGASLIGACVALYSVVFSLPILHF